MKGLLVFPIIRDLNKADGILVKNEGIKQGFIKNGVDLDVIEFYSDGIRRNGKCFFKFPKNKYARIVSYNLLSWKAILREVKGSDYDFVWFRTPLVMRPIYLFIKGLSEQFSGSKIILEYGYYPYINELSSAKKLLYKLNRSNEIRAHRHAHFVVTYAGQKSVDNLPNIPINNGIDLDGLPVVEIKTNVLERLNLISVSSLKKWHAYERLVAGLAEYSKKPNALPVHFNIVGLGPEYEKIATLVQELKVGAQVTFHGFKTGKELDEIYNDNHLAIGTLGFHRIGITFSSSLKNREYFGRGLPIVVSTFDEDMPKELPYVEYVTEGEEPIDIEQVVAFAQKVYQSPNVNSQVRAHAEGHVSWASKIKTVLSYVQGEPLTKV